ncbi:hypothetical protein N7510_008435 [Penicillium lagena]|uniref:uncharacterized protein n=1 Tax=Penicillium lagena TaxID=94218 RepID=UPI00253FA167|nr:uncharacterized protein N7510_008435 [Penicillium lagena]KAJ5605654.1 hypothetical protein N7510_008435 [Penicillium lagena]
MSATRVNRPGHLAALFLTRPTRGTFNNSSHSTRGTPAIHRVTSGFASTQPGGSSAHIAFTASVAEHDANHPRQSSAAAIRQNANVVFFEHVTARRINKQFTRTWLTDDL